MVSIKSRAIMMVCAAMAALGPAHATAQGAETITLISLDGKVVISGKLQGFAEGYYNIVVVGIGLMSVAQELVTCQSTSIDCAALVSRS